MSEIVLCKNCKWFTPSSEWSSADHKSKYAICQLTSKVDGTDGIPCHQRRNRIFDRCGKSGRLFVQAEIKQAVEA